MSALQVEDLMVSYDRTPVLFDISFDLPERKLIGVIGPNGAGKSTLLKAVLGIVKPLSGKVLFFGKELKEVLKRVAYVPQRSSIDWDFPITALEVVAMGRYGKLGMFGRLSKADKLAAKQALKTVEMENFAGRQIRELSGGQQQRLFLARALLQDADLFLMDEPFAGVDMATEKAILALLEKLCAQGKTIIVVHHDLGTVRATFNHLVMLNTGLIAAGPIDEVFTKGNLAKAYGKGSAILDEAVRLSQMTSEGLLR